MSVASKAKIFAGNEYAMNLRLPTHITHEDALRAVKASFEALGFGLPSGTTDMDMADVLEKKGFICGPCKKYSVLGFCSPSHASRALTIEPAIGLLLPCNVAVTTTPDGVVEVAAMDPTMMIGIVNKKDELKPLMEEVRRLIKDAMEAVATSCRITEGKEGLEKNT